MSMLKKEAQILGKREGHTSGHIIQKLEMEVLYANCLLQETSDMSEIHLTRRVSRIVSLLGKLTSLPTGASLYCLLKKNS